VSAEQRTYPGIVNHLQLPVLLDRTPADTPTECYYWSGGSEPTAGNGCPD
jgi:hypothetical protein